MDMASSPLDTVAAVSKNDGARTFRIAAVDLGTVSSRLALAEVTDGVIASLQKRTVITDLGEGVDATGVFADSAVQRVLDACEGFMRDIAAFKPDRVCTTLTSAARDVSNGERLLRELEALGLRPQVIPGEVEARLTFYGVAHDFPGQRIVVADSGGGSTELAVGSYTPGAQLSLDHVQSLNIGCRRVTERFLTSDPAGADERSAAAEWIHPQFAAYWGALPQHPDRLVAVGGTVTTLVAIVNELKVYDSHFVHLRDLTLEQVDSCIERMRGLRVEEIAQLSGIQAKRAPVILAGAITIRELMVSGGYDRLTVSENSLLAGMAETIYEVLSGQEPAIGWTPELSW